MIGLSLARWHQRRQTRQIGGLRLPRDKPGLPNSGRLRTLSLPRELVLPLLNHRREPLPAYVRPGDRVMLGQPLADGVIASADGRVVAIEARPVIHPSGQTAPCVVLQTDLNDSSVTERPRLPELPTLTIARLRAADVRGLGGAAFPTAAKLAAACQSRKVMDILLINAVECEPRIACDEALMLCEAPAIVRAVAALKQATGCRRCIVAVEDDKTAAIEALRRALQTQPVELELLLLEPIYPAGAERTLIRRITGRRLAAGEHPSSLGILSVNVATALAADRARQGYPQVSRIVTVCGDDLPASVNVRVRFGTPVIDVLHQCGYEVGASRPHVRANGPLSGFDLHSLQAPVDASTNSLILSRPAADTLASPCIRCGACEQVCPEQLLPQQLYWHARADDLPGSRRFGLESCITCGCCDLVCPSGIPLTAGFRHAQSVYREQQRRDELAALSRQRFESRQQRLARREEDRERRRRQVEERLQSGSDPIADALARARRRRRSRSRTPNESRPSPDDRT